MDAVHEWAVSKGILPNGSEAGYWTCKFCSWLRLKVL